MSWIVELRNSNLEQFRKNKLSFKDNVILIRKVKFLFGSMNITALDNILNFINEIMKRFVFMNLWFLNFYGKYLFSYLAKKS